MIWPQLKVPHLNLNKLVMTFSNSNSSSLECLSSLEAVGAWSNIDLYFLTCNLNTLSRACPKYINGRNLSSWIMRGGDWGREWYALAHLYKGHQQKSRRNMTELDHEQHDSLSWSDGFGDVHYFVIVVTFFCRSIQRRMRFDVSEGNVSLDCFQLWIYTSRSFPREMLSSLISYFSFEFFFNMLISIYYCRQ